MFKKTVLAVVISAASSHAFATAGYNVGTGPTTFTGTIPGTMTLTGHRVQVDSSDILGVKVSQAAVQGSILNQADITFTTSTFRTATGLGIDSGFSSGLTAGSTVAGDVINSGTISFTGVHGAEGFEIGNSVISGSVINNGVVRIVEQVGAGYGVEAMYLHGTSIGGDLINNGTLDSQGDGSTGLILDSHFGVTLNIAGKIINTGTIRATGNNALGFDVETPTSPLRIENSGLIEANGNGALAVSLSVHSVIDSLNNSATINAMGANAVAVDVDGATFTQTSPSGQRGLINTGTIQSQGVGILVGHTYTTSAFEINQKAGLISGVGTAIDGGNLATLNWTGGAIVGDLLNLTATNIAGQANFTGQTIDSNVAISSGSLNLKQQGTRITDNLHVSSGAGVDMLLSDRVTPSSPYLNVGGTATFDQGSKVTLSANPGDFTPTANGTQYTLIRANTLVNNGLAVSSASSLLSVSSYTVDGHDVNAVVTVKNDNDVNQGLANASASPTTQLLVNTFKNGVMGKLPGNDPVFQAFANTASNEELAKLGASLAPDVSRGAVDAAVSSQGMSNNAILGRVSGLRSGLSSGDVLSETGVWVQGLNSSLDQDSRDGVAGYSANASGIAVGADGKLNPNTTVGLAYSYLNTNVTSATGNKTDVQGNALSLYGSWALNRWFVDGAASYGRNDNDSKRYVAGTAAKGSYDSDVLSLSALGGYTFDVSEHLQVEPRVAARYANVQIDSFNEHGSSAALHNNAQRFEIGELGAGVRLIGNLPLLNGTLEPEATLMAYHDFIGDQVNQTSSFQAGGSAFVVSGTSPVRDTYEGSVGVNYQINAFTVGANYTYQAKSGFDSDTVLLKAKYAF
ncbi:autotransporter domain-containing protein [Pseudomonas sp. NA-150]|uniref:autotransporter family protein n=1 Tax=Pseudomonas sp. NA-150 TaxID=3367525 RepID=UPI0037C900A1